METAPASNPLAIPPALAAELQAIADEQHRPALDVLQDAVTRYVTAARRGDGMVRAEQEDQRARELGILDDEDDQPMTDAYRQTLREKIAQGVRSLREGRVTDGPAFMARMDAELAELERQGQ
jgi:uncharacterized protein YicC (UPF0701 family)